MSKQSYSASAEANLMIEAIEDVYQRLKVSQDDEDKDLVAYIDTVANELLAKCRSTRYGLGEKGARELAGKLAIWVVSHKLEKPDLAKMMRMMREKRIGGGTHERK